jgi:Rieske Fe-S protein
MNKVIVLLLMFLAVACKDNTPQQNVFIPNVPVNVTVNTDLPLHFHLKTMGTHSYLNGGNRGIILIHNFDDLFYAVERTCTFQSDLACSKIFVDSSNFQLRCGGYESGTWESCCNSKFAFDGNVLEGPAQFPLKLYRILENGSLITVSN